MSEHLLFISDLHLDPSRPEITELFLNFLQGDAREAKALYILGDFFESWIGDDDHSAFSDRIRRALGEATAAGLPIYFMHGNRDFLLSSGFARETGIRLLPDPTLINAFGRDALLMHGDLLCTDDIKYQKFRRIAHNSILQSVFLLLPLWLRRRIAGKARERSTEVKASTDMQIMDVNQATVIEYLQVHNSDLLIHGHTHRPDTHDLMIDDKPAQRIVLGAWFEGGSVLRLDADGTLQLKTF